jgi:parallel beta-helix repeat protein
MKICKSLIPLKLMLSVEGNWMRGLFSRSKVIGITLALLMLATSAVALGIQPVKVAHASTVIIVPDDYATIQDAIGNASAGDTVYVRAGTYQDCLTINKPLTLKGESNKNTTVTLFSSRINGPSLGLWITASNVTVSGFHFVSTTYLIGLVVIDGRNSVANNDVIMDNVLEEKPPYCDALVAISSQDDRIILNTVLARMNMLDEGGSTITLDGSDNCLVAKNNIVAGWVGILIGGNHNVVAFNHVANQTDTMRLQCGGILAANPSSYNTIVGNTLLGNDYGVSCWRLSHDNVIYHNNFINNVYQGYSESSLNSWDNGYPSGGNYWSDYNGTDSFMGPYQNVTGSDGIGDTSMVMTPPKGTWGIEFADRYPLMNPVNDFIGDVNLDGKVDIKDISLVARSFGSVLGDLRWNPHADLNGDNRIDIFDVAIVARNFGKSWL